jgi:hypothetical protein
MAQTIAIDFDGVIHAYSKGWYNGTAYDKPVPGALEAIDELMKTYAVAIFTTRDVYQVGDWFVDHGRNNVTMVWTPPFWNDRGRILITNVKPAALAYVDDRAIRFVNWEQTLLALRTFNIKPVRKEHADLYS